MRSLRSMATNALSAHFQRMGKLKMLKGYKDILRKLRDVWGTDVGLPSVMRWCAQKSDPLPVKRINPTKGPRPIIVADAEEVERWALRQIA